MPGPRNNKRKAKPRGRNLKRGNGTSPELLRNPVGESRVGDFHQQRRRSNSNTSSSISPSPSSLRTPSPVSFDFHDLRKELSKLEEDVPRIVEEVLFQEPFIYDPGNGPRVRDPRAFMSSFFAQPPTLEDPLCAEFAQEEVLQMLSTVLPDETALILWYNKSRSHSRVCPSCQRLYRVGDALPDLIDEGVPSDKSMSPELLREQKISGLCSPVCFIVASFNFPGAIRSAWGSMGDEMDDDAWELLNGPGETVAINDVSRTLGMLVKMTRLHDLGLAQLCFDAEEASLLQTAGELELGPAPVMAP
ncbi:hypothetical protein GALMADRAFT_250790 [Galerina marginata CBS 339.88]|uniref:Uncharacterized protein n=1 Tax=Galerina marginata (strain CBS 339.88) TaxID=685588 RepID=A0A067ST55_GALM3|nr:hypothetical protein GALMADRAFT_250790 [Galerina marginata CBS 339.88]